MDREIARRAARTLLVLLDDSYRIVAKSSTAARSFEGVYVRDRLAPEAELAVSRLQPDGGLVLLPRGLMMRIIPLAGLGGERWAVTFEEYRTRAQDI